MGEVAITMPECMTLENHSPWDIAHSWIQSCWRKVRPAAKLFLQISRIIISQSIVECQPASGFPRVLSVHSELSFTNSWSYRISNGYLFDKAQKKAGITESGGLAIQRGSVKVGKTGLVRRE